MTGLDHPLLDPDSRAFAEDVRRVATEELADDSFPERERAGDFWEAGWRRCADLGLCGLPAPTEWGGRGASRLATAAALEALGYGCPDAGLVFSLNAHLWSAVIPLWKFGSARQREAYLPRLCSGDWIGLHAMTEPESGSDAFALRTVARPVGDEFVISGSKTMITNAPQATLFIIFARLPETEGVRGVTPFLVERGAPGLEVARPMQKLGLRTSPLGELTLNDVSVSRDAILGRPGRGAQVFAASMQWERLLIMAGQIGALQQSLEQAIGCARERRSRGYVIGDVADRLVDTDVALAAARALLYETAWAYDQGESGPARAAAVKLFAAETVLRGALELPQVLDGLAYHAESPFDRRLRDALGGRLYSGTSQMMRQIVARGMGL